MAVLIAITFLLCSIAIAAAALVVAPVLGVDRLLSKLLGPWAIWASGSPAMIDELADLADLARRDGLLAIESSVTVKHDPLLCAALAMSTAGKPAAVIREELERQAAARTLRRLLSHLPGILQITAISAAGGTLIGILLGLLGGIPPASMGWIIAWFTLCTALMTMTLASTAAESVGAASPRLCTRMRIEAAVLIASGHDGRSVRVALAAMLMDPASQSSADAESLARAA